MSLFDLPPVGPDPKRPAKSSAQGAAGKASSQAGSRSGSASQSATPERAPAPKGNDSVIGVSEVTARIGQQLSGLGSLAVEGEVSALKRAGSGHLYFTLKDEKASISCAVWRSRVASGVRFDLQGGQQVICHGRLDVYAPRGNYSLIVDRIEQRGMGELLARLERLKADLRAKGWFDRKRPIPTRPRCIGLVTSRDADALRDFLRTRSLRWPGYPVRLCHTRVQGPGSAQEIARAIQRLDDGRVDVICVVRGGGSMEDLWAFNELPVAEAVWNCSVPVISGVGHESDTTLIDHITDLRAHTPTNAGEHAIPDRGVLFERLERAQAYLESAMERHVQGRAQALQRLAQRSSLASVDGLLRAPMLQLQNLEGRLAQALRARIGAQEARLERYSARMARVSPGARLASMQGRVQALEPRLARAIATYLQRAEQRLGAQERVLQAISPLAVLGRGYSIVQRADDGRAVRAADEVQPKDALRITFASGSADAVVTQTQASEPDDVEQAGAGS